VSAPLTIRAATAADVDEILALVRELAVYEREPDAVTATAADLLRDGFGAEPRFRVLLACEGDKVAGFAFYFFAYSTWRAQPTLYLEDLFVRPAYRRRGLGVALMRRLADEAVKTRCGRFQWQVLDWNESAVRFYESLGAKIMREWWTVRIEGDDIARFAAAQGGAESP
jgi:GNAT superfamily N-acetyltransferase